MSEREPAAAPGTARRDMLLGGALLVTAGLAFARTPREHQSALGSAKLEAIVPERMGAWTFETESGLILPPPDQLQDKIYSQLVTRQYRRGDDAVMLLIAYSDRQDGAIQVHRPEVCYPASGLPILSSVPITLSLPGTQPIPARRLVAGGQMRDEELIYWTRIGDHFPTVWAGSHLAVMRENLAGIIPDGVLVRISCLAGPDSAALLADFAQAMAASAGPRFRRVLLG